jgi:hypothetical protein
MNSKTATTATGETVTIYSGWLIDVLFIVPGIVAGKQAADFGSIILLSSPVVNDVGVLAHEESHAADVAAMGVLPYMLRWLSSAAFRAQCEAKAIAAQDAAEKAAVSK